MSRKNRKLKNIELDSPSKKFLDSKKPSTKHVYEFALKQFILFYGKQLGEYITEIENQSKENEGKPLIERVRPGEEAIRKYIKWLQEEGYSNKSIRVSLAAIQNALKFYGLEMTWRFIELPPNSTQKKNSKHPWTLEEMKQFVDAAEYLRDKSMILLAFQSGLSVSDIVSLNYGDIKRELDSDKLPLMIELTRIKTEVPYRTFIGFDTVQILKEYLKSRGQLKDKDPLFTMLGSKRRVTRYAFEKQLRVIAKKLDFIIDFDEDGAYNPARPHSLRSAFRSMLTGKMSDTLIEFFMGHNIGEEKRTYLNMPPDELRELYANHELFLSINKTSKQDKESSNVLSEQTIKEIRALQSVITELRISNLELKAKQEKNDRLLKMLLEAHKELEGISELVKEDK